MNQTGETFAFQAEAKELLGLMIHSIYSNKEIFLRELISNASDALDKLRFESLTNSALLTEGTRLEIRLAVDPEARTLTIADNGIGMSHDELIEHIGTIARSGTRQLLEKLKKENKAGPELIGQFGIGFYSSFMVADEVEILSRRAGQQQAFRWVSKGDGQYTITPAEKEQSGCQITLKLKPKDDEAGLHDFTSDAELRRIVKKYSDFVSYPIVMNEKGEDKTLNSQRPLWSRQQSEVSEAEYKEFYKHISHDWEEPAKTITLRAEGNFEYQALLFLPKQPPFDLFYREFKRGLRLYVRRILILDQCEELLPPYLRFVRGVVDAADLPLNVSRELLQHNRQLGQIKKRLAKKVLDTLTQLAADDPKAYADWWSDFGQVLKEGYNDDAENHEKLTELLRYPSSHDQEALTSLAGYLERMKPDQEFIFYSSGESRERVENAPHLEAFKEKGIEVLYFVENVDELVAQALPEFKGKKLKSVSKGAFELGSEEEKKAAEKKREEESQRFSSLFKRMQSVLEAHVREVRVSDRLTSSPACLVGGEHDLSPHLERLLAATKQGLPRQKRVLEVNPKHPILAALGRLFLASPDDPVIADYAELLYGQALLAEGSPLPDPVKFSQRLAELMVRASGGSGASAS